MILIFIAFFFFLLYAGLLLYYRSGWAALKTFNANRRVTDTFISVIIPARNEEHSLPRLLSSLRNQTYPANRFEVIVIDDHSSDNTPSIVSKFALKNVKLIKLADHIESGINSYKKKAIEIAISQSSGELIVTTDADCVTTPEWLQTIAAFYEHESKPCMIIMPVAIENNKSFIGIFQLLDFMTLQGVTGGAVQQKLHAMCNGANLAYTRDAFYEVNGFQDIDAVASGDDMLLMNKIQRHRPGSIRYLKSQKVVVRTSAMSTVGDFFNQRIRWASKTSQYKQESILFSAAMVYVFNVVLLILFMSALLNNKAHTIAGLNFTTLAAFITTLIAKIFVELHFLLPVALFFKQVRELIYFPFMQPLHIIYTIIAGALGTFGNYDWKGRKVK